MGDSPEERAARIVRTDAYTPLYEQMVAREIREAVEAEREACAKLCDSFVAERVASINRLKNHRETDERVIWLDCKRSEAERCAEKIRARGKEAPRVG